MEMGFRLIDLCIVNATSYAEHILASRVSVAIKLRKRVYLLSIHIYIDINEDVRIHLSII